MENEEIEKQEISQEPVKEVTEEDLQEEQEPRNLQMPEYVKEIELKNRQLWERTKKAETKNKELDERLEEIEKKVPLTSSGTSDTDVDRILEIKYATEGLDAKQIGFLRNLSKSNKTSLTDARQGEDFALWSEAYQRKVEKEQAALPSTTVGNVEKEKSLEEMNIEERTKLFEEAGLLKKRINPRPPLQ